MLVIHKKQIIIILILFISFFSCKKENDTIPNILISKPLSNQSFQIPTSINVIGSTWDDNLITRIEIDIISENSASIVQKKEINVDTNYFDFNISLFLTDRLISTDNYFINVKSFDENNNYNSEYIPININEVPKTLQATYYITSLNNITYLYENDSLNNLHLKYQISGNYTVSLGNSRHQYLFFGTDQLVECIEPIYYNDIWDLTSSNPFINSHTGVYKTDNGNQLHLGYEDGRIFTFNKEGNTINTIYSNNQDLFGEFFVDEDIVLVENKTSSLDKKLIVFFKQSGIEKQRIITTGTIEKILPLGSQQYFIISNFLGVSKLSIYYENTNIISTELEIPNCNIYDAVILNNNILIASSNGFYSFNLTNNSLNTVSTSHLCDKIVLDELNKNVYLICGKQLWSYNNFSSLNLLNTLQDSIKDFVPFYNK